MITKAPNDELASNLDSAKNKLFEASLIFNSGPQHAQERRKKQATDFSHKKMLLRTYDTALLALTQQACKTRRERMRFKSGQRRRRHHQE